MTPEQAVKAASNEVFKQGGTNRDGVSDPKCGDERHPDRGPESDMGGDDKGGK